MLYSIFKAICGNTNQRNPECTLKFSTELYRVNRYLCVFIGQSSTTFVSRFLDSNLAASDDNLVTMSAMKIVDILKACKQTIVDQALGKIEVKARWVNCICLRTRQEIYGQIWPQSKAVPEGAARGNTRELRLYFLVYPSSCPHP